MTIRTDVTVDWELSPRIIRVAAPSTGITIQDLVDTCRYHEEMLINLDDSHLIDAAGKDFLGGTTYVGITATLQNAKVTFEARKTPLVSGSTATSDDTAGITLTDSGATFLSDSLYQGCTVFNGSTASMGVLLEIISDTQIRHTELGGGMSTEWTTGDYYSIYPNVQCSILGGNLVAVDGVGSNIDPVLQSANVQVVMTASSSATLQEQEALQFSSYNGGVTVDITSSHTGVDYPIGTAQAPVNNLQDALDIAADRGFNVFFVLGDLTIDGGLNFSQISFVGESIDKSEFTIDSDADVTQCEFYEATVQGTLDGECKIKDCNILNVNYVSGVVELCIISGDILLGGGTEAYFLDCWAGSLLGAPPTIDIGGSGQTLVMQNFNGYIKWKNLSGTSDQANASLNAGWLILENTITAGWVNVIGTGVVEDYSTGTAVVNTEHLVNPHNIRDRVWSDARAQLLYDMEGGRWKLTNNQMIFYEEDNLTEVARFNLYDASGTPTTDNVYERRRVQDDSWMYPYALIVNTGSVSSGTIANIQTVDASSLILNETTSAPGFDYTFMFTKVQTTSLTVDLTGYYEGNPAHNVKAVVFNWINCTWADMTMDAQDFPSRSTDDSYSFSLPSPLVNHVSSQGHFLFGVKHTSNGSAGHTFNINQLKLTEV